MVLNVVCRGCCGNTRVQPGTSGDDSSWMWRVIGGDVLMDGLVRSLIPRSRYYGRKRLFLHHFRGG